MKESAPPPTNTDHPVAIDIADIQQLIGGLYLQIEVLRKQNAELQQKLAAWERR
jgi:hypothetical protein